MTISPYFLSEPSNIFHKSDDLVVHFFINRMALTVREPAWRPGVDGVGGKVAEQSFRMRRGCVKSHFLCYKSPPRARMASLQNNFLDFLGLFAQPQDLHSRVDTLQGPETSAGRTRLLSSHSSGQGKSARVCRAVSQTSSATPSDHGANLRI